uniref:Sialic acid acetylesterase n=1 Tax=Latimeria chalumnae TaxID=7897 RepID=H3AYI4_LATCH
LQVLGLQFITAIILIHEIHVTTAKKDVFGFASYFSDHMVLQMKPAGAVIWGYTEAGFNVTVTVSNKGKIFTKKMAKTTAQRLVGSAIWKVILDPMPPGGPFLVTVKKHHDEQEKSIVLKDIWFGDVWFCSGQSNMEMTVLQIMNATEELAMASHYPHIRLFTVAHKQSPQELEDLSQISLQWAEPTAGNLGHGDFTYFSAVCWLYGRYLYDKLGYPIGLVQSTWGGTPIEAWSSKRALRKCGLSEDTKQKHTDSSFVDFKCINEFKFSCSSVSVSRFTDDLTGPSFPSILWNAMIHPLINMTIKGVIWYQGEANANLHTDLYNCTFPAMIEDWRNSFHEGSQAQTEPLFPFGFVQLSSDKNPTEEVTFPEIRWHQTADYGYAPNPKMPNTFMAVAMDLGDQTSPFGRIHPRYKQDVAYRLHLGARALVYGESKLVYQGPFPYQIKVHQSKELISITYKQKLYINHLNSSLFEVINTCNYGKMGTKCVIWRES